MRASVTSSETTKIVRSTECWANQLLGPPAFHGDIFDAPSKGALYLCWPRTWIRSANAFKIPKLAKMLGEEATVVSGAKQGVLKLSSPFVVASASMCKHVQAV